jgi:hypothetical protein
MNKNTRSRQKQLRKATLEFGGFAKPVYKKKSKPFPTPNKEGSENLSMTVQAKFFNNPGTQLGV